MKEQLILQIIIMINHYLRTGAYNSSFFKDFAIKDIEVSYDEETLYHSLKDWCERIKDDKGQCVYIESNLSNEFVVVCEFEHYIRVWKFSFSYDGIMWTLKFEHDEEELQKNKMIYSFEDQVSEYKKAVRMMVKTSESLFMSKWANLFSGSLSEMVSDREFLEDYNTSFSANERRVLHSLENLWIFGKVGDWNDLPKTRASQLGYHEFGAKSHKFQEEYVRTMKIIMKK